MLWWNGVWVRVVEEGEGDGSVGGGGGGGMNGNVPVVVVEGTVVVVAQR